jgi:hypothetical protein
MTTPAAPRGQTLLAVGFADPGADPDPVQLAIGAMGTVLGQCVQRGLSPDGLLNASVGAAGDLLELYEGISGNVGTPETPATVGIADQTLATMRAEPTRFAALAFCHASPAGTVRVELPPRPRLWTPE